MKQGFRLGAWLVVFLFAGGCREGKHPYKILGNIEDPQNEITKTIATILNQKIKDSIEVVAGIGSKANLDSLEMGLADWRIAGINFRDDGNWWRSFFESVAVFVPLGKTQNHWRHRGRIHRG